MQIASTGGDVNWYILTGTVLTMITGFWLVYRIDKYGKTTQKDINFIKWFIDLIMM